MTQSTGVGRGRSGRGVPGRGRQPLPMPEVVAERGACLNVVVDMTPGFAFLGRGGGRDMEKEEQAAIEVCHRCPDDVFAACRAWGIADPTVGGVVGSLTERERRIERNRR